jgi:NNP family nitrate/nitrite transporter-like MFS transporter
MISNPVGGLISDRVGERPVLVASFIALGVGTFLFRETSWGALMYSLIFVLGWFINFVRSPSFAVIPRLYGVERAGKVSGMQNTFASIGALILPLFLGYIRDATASYSAGWTVLSLLLVSVGLLNLLLESPFGNEGS